MKRIILFLIASVLFLSSCSVLSQMDSRYLSRAAGSALTAASINDQQIAELSAQTIAHLDSQNKIDNGAYQQRLSKLLSGLKVGDMTFNFKVYQTSEINAFACGDGSIRVYSGLMDVMNDAELMAIIGHEIGHVVHKDTKNAMKKAYLASAARDVIGAAGGTVGAIAASAVGDIAESYVGAQFSQKQEYAADDYGFSFAVSQGYDKYSMANALGKLVQISGGAQASQVQKMFSSHPDSAARAEKMRIKADNMQ